MLHTAQKLTQANYYQIAWYYTGGRFVLFCLHTIILTYTFLYTHNIHKLARAPSFVLCFTGGDLVLSCMCDCLYVHTHMHVNEAIHSQIASSYLTYLHVQLCISEWYLSVYVGLFILTYIMYLFLVVNLCTCTHLFVCKHRHIFALVYHVHAYICTFIYLCLSILTYGC